MFKEGDKVIYMKSQPWCRGGWWKETPATVLSWNRQTSRYAIRLDSGGRTRYVAFYSIRAAATG
jgi:hypothetical protein